MTLNRIKRCVSNPIVFMLSITMFCVQHTTLAQVAAPNYHVTDDFGNAFEGYSGREFNLQELYTVLGQWDTKTPLIFKDCNFQSMDYPGDWKMDGRFLWMMDDYTDNSFNGFADLVPDQIIKYQLIFDNCSFEPNSNSQIVFQKFHFKQGVRLNNCRGYGLMFSRCVFEKTLELNDLQTRYFDIVGSHFYHSVDFNDVNVATSTIAGSFFLQTLEGDTNLERDFGLVFYNKNEFDHLVLRNNEFISKVFLSHDSKSLVLSKFEILHFENFNTDKLTIERCTFSCTPIFGNFSAATSFKLEESNQFKGKIIFKESPKIPTEGSIIPFSLLENRLGYFTESKDSADSYLSFMDYTNDGDFHTKDEDRPWIRLDVESDIVPTYSKLLSIYRATSDSESHNKCFIKLKKIEEDIYKWRYKLTRSWTDAFRWGINWFLGKFSKYGTDPILTLMNCLKWIAIFAIFYMFFPSEEDNLKYHNIQLALHRYIDHFSYEKKNFYTADELYKAEVVELNIFKRALINNRLRLPPVLSIFGKPFFRFSLFIVWIRHRIRSVIRFNIYQDWSSQGRRGRLKMTSYISISLVGFLLWGLVMRVLNALALSLNAFVTLGYGEIMAKGVSRYLCVLEGLMGWFFLSIFSVALISQILSG